MSLFAGATGRPAHRLRRVRFLVASALVQGGVLALVFLLHPRPGAEGQPARAEPVVAVRLLQPHLRAPAPPPSPGKPLPHPRRPAEPSPARMVQPRVVAVEMPLDPHPVEPAAQAPDGEASPDATGPGGQPGGVVGGAPDVPDGPALQQPRTRPIAARTHDLASVRAGIARTLVYPPNARRNGLQGRVLLEFVLLADGWIRDLVLRSGSGVPVLDDAALSAVEKAAPFPAPGVDVLVSVPVVFRAE